jgi:pilus assembly protein CpaE
MLSHHLPTVPMVQVPNYLRREQLVELLFSHPSQLCFLDVSTDQERAQTALSDLLAAEPSMQIVVLLNANEPDLILRCLRQGASEFLLQPFSTEEIKPVLDRLARLGPGLHGLRKGGKVYCVTPAKGACGASTVAVGLAYQWKRLGSKRILLADLDPLLGTVSFLLKLKSNYSFLDAVSRADGLDEDLWKGMITSCQGVDVLLSPDNPVDGAQDLQTPTGIIEFSRQLYDTVIIDTGTIHGEWGLAIAAACDELLLVTTNELPSLQATQRTLAYFDRNRVDRSKIRLIVNRYRREVGLSEEAIATALHTDVFHLIPSDYDAVQRALMEGKAIPPGSAYSKSLTALASRLVGGGSNTLPKMKKKKNSPLGGLFSALFSRVSS